mmetsp:Transcript_6012/g.17864  ORF Transcript_6012/g.17864 Transcript_6012/m.17864 type:complete len:423 (+) Transcript_6012:886-2154(+)
MTLFSVCMRWSSSRSSADVSGGFFIDLTAYHASGTITWRASTTTPKPPCPSCGPCSRSFSVTPSSTCPAASRSLKSWYLLIASIHVAELAAANPTGSSSPGACTLTKRRHISPAWESIVASSRPTSARSRRAIVGLAEEPFIEPSLARGSRSARRGVQLPAARRDVSSGQLPGASSAASFSLSACLIWSRMATLCLVSTSRCAYWGARTRKSMVVVSRRPSLVVSSEWIEAEMILSPACTSASETSVHVTECRSTVTSSNGPRWADVGGVDDASERLEGLLGRSDAAAIAAEAGAPEGAPESATSESKRFSREPVRETALRAAEAGRTSTEATSSMSSPLTTRRRVVSAPPSASAASAACSARESIESGLRCCESSTCSPSSARGDCEIHWIDMSSGSRLRWSRRKVSTGQMSSAAPSSQAE